MRELQTPQNQARSAKLSNRMSKKNTAKKSLNAVFSPTASEDVPLETPKHSIESTPISVISEVDHNIDDISENLMLVPNPALSASSEALFPFDLTPSSEVTTDKDEPGHVSWSIAKSSKFNGSNFGSVEAEIVASAIRKARNQALNAVDVDIESKKLLDAVVEIVIDQLHHVPVERDRMAELLAAKSKMVFMCIMFWILAIVALFVFSSGARSTRHGPLPT